MRRYANIPIQTRFDGKRVYKTTIYPVVLPADTDIQVVSNEGDYLDILSYKYYGDPTLYWIIASVNKIGKGRLSVQPGLTLRIPVNVNDIIDQFNRLNA
jgi:nucleoid-associated protein YgaU